MLHNSQPAAACIVEFAGGPGSWVARTYTATKGGGAFFNGQRLETSATSAINQSLLVGNGASVSRCPLLLTLAVLTACSCASCCPLAVALSMTSTQRRLAGIHMPAAAQVTGFGYEHDEARLLLHHFNSELM